VPPRARFVLTPLASNASELVSSLRFAARKRPRAISLTLSQIYGAVRAARRSPARRVSRWRGRAWRAALRPAR